MDNIWFIAAFWMGLALLASLISIRLGISVALIEILVGVIVGNLHTANQAPLLHTTEWTNFLAMLGSGVLTFLAGAEIDPNLITRLGATRVSEPEVKFLFLVLFFLGGLASTAKSEAVLPAYLLGLGVAGVFLRDKTLVHRMRSIAFAIFTPFYFIKAGLFVSLAALSAAVGVIAVLLFLKMATKIMGVWPLSRYFFRRSREANYTALLMSTGLTFGTISALFGLQNKIIDQNQYSVLVTVVIPGGISAPRYGARGARLPNLRVARGSQARWPCLALDMPVPRRSWD